MPSALKKGTALVRRRTGVIREIAGFTTKPDGVRRARMVIPGTKDETRVKVDQIYQTYSPLDW